jgi:hypothetical protein
VPRSGPVRLVRSGSPRTAPAPRPVLAQVHSSKLSESKRVLGNNSNLGIARSQESPPQPGGSFCWSARLACCKVGLDGPLIPTAIVANLFRSARVSRPRRSAVSFGEGLQTPPFGCFVRRGSPDPAVRLTAGFQVTRRWSGTGRAAVAEAGGSADHCPNQLVQDQLFTGTGRARGSKK